MGLEIKLCRVNQEKYREEAEYLKQQIVNGSNKHQFLALNHEAGFGKTLYAEQALIEAVLAGKKSIFCRKFIENCNQSVERINKDYGMDIAIAIDSENVAKNKHRIHEYPIVVISHERYVRLSLDKKEREIFTYSRDILVIDEEVDIVKPIVISPKSISDFSGKLMKYRRTRKLYEECIKEIYEFLCTNKKRIFYKPCNNKNEELRQLRGFIDSNIDANYAEHLDMTKDDFYREIDMLEIALNNLSVVENSILYTYNNGVKYWMLENNILLDACADFNYLYKISSKFNIASQEKVVDHSRCTINIAKYNSCRTKKEKTKDFYGIINEDIIARLQGDDKMLVLGSKDERDKVVRNAQVSYAWFQNIVGKNDWRDFNKCYIILNPQIPFAIYILKYMFYSGFSFNVGDKWSTGNIDNVHRFRNKEFEKVRQTVITAELYQAIKRINRNNNKSAEVYVINNDQQILDKLIEQFNNIKVKEYFLNLEDKVNEKKVANAKEQADEDKYYYTAFITLISKLNKGVYQKKWVREQIGFSNPKNFSKEILNKEVVMKYMAEANIKPKGQSIIVG